MSFLLEEIFLEQKYFSFAEFDGEREEEDFVFQIICRLKHVSQLR